MSGKIISNSLNISKRINTGGIAGYSTVNILSSYNNNSINVIGENLDLCLIGGIVGWQNSNSIENCKNTSDVTLKVTGSTSPWCGGIAGGTWEVATISKCSNTGKITSEGEVNTTIHTDNVEHVNVGGIIGCLYKESTLSECYNTGTITGTITCEKNKYVLSGGIAGENFGSISDCYNKGEIYTLNRDTTSAACVGGIVGYQDSSGSVRNSYNTNLNIRGSIPPFNEPVHEAKGLIVGYNKEGSVSNSYYYADTSKDSNYYAIIGIDGGTNSGTIQKENANYLKEIATLLGNNWGSSTTINDGYPYLINNKP